MIDENASVWSRLIHDALVFAGTMYCGLKITDAAEKYIEENE